MNEPYDPETEFVVSGTNWIDEDRAKANIEIFAATDDGPEVVIATALNPYTGNGTQQNVAVDTGTARIIAYTILEAANYLDKQQPPPELAHATVTGRPSPVKPARRVPRYREQWHYDITPITKLPLPDDLEDPPCMAGGVSAAARAWRQRRPKPAPRSCCWFHGGSWAEASRIAMALVGGITLKADNGVAEDDDPFDPVRDRLRAAGLTGWMHDAVRSLICGGEPINIGSTEDWENPEEEPFYVGGRHRAAAMISQGVKKTVTMRLELTELP